nr:hypothetical protein [Actinomycetota bacterium]
MTGPGEVGPEDVVAATIDTDTTKRFRRAAPVVVCRNGCSGDLARTYVDQRSGWRWLRIGPTHGRDQQSRSATRTPSARLIDTPDDVHRLEQLLEADGLVATGSTGQPRLSQVVAELRQARLAASRLMDALALPLDDDGTAATPASK